MKAYILINVRIGGLTEVIRHLKHLSAVKTAEMTFGEYDVIAIVETADVKTLALLVAKHIQIIPDVLRTVTCMAVDIDN